MKIENITVGATYKNWKALCEVLGVEPKSGSYKQKQERDFKQYFNWEKNGQKITITEIYDTVQEREDGRKGNTFTERHEQEPVFTKNELQLAVLWILGKKAYETPKKHEKYEGFCIPTKEMYIAVGLCNEFYNMLVRDKYYYTKLTKQDEGVYWKWQVDLAFNSVYTDMKKRMITAFNQLQRKKVLEFSYWKATVTGSGELVPFTDKQMGLFLKLREDTIEWWDATHTNTYYTINKFYERANAKEVREFEDKLKKQMIESKQFGRNFEIYTSCFKINYDLRSILKELTERGYKVDTYSDFKDSFTSSMKYVVKRINEKFIQRHLEYLDKKRDEHFEVFDKFIREQEKIEVPTEGRRTLGRGKKIETVKEPFHALTDSDVYEDTKGLMMLGMKQKDDLSKEELGTLQGIEHKIKERLNK